MKRISNETLVLMRIRRYLKSKGSPAAMIDGVVEAGKGGSALPCPVIKKDVQNRIREAMPSVGNWVKLVRLNDGLFRVYPSAAVKKASKACKTNQPWKKNAKKAIVQKPATTKLYENAKKRFSGEVAILKDKWQNKHLTNKDIAEYFDVSQSYIGIAAKALHLGPRTERVKHFVASRKGKKFQKVAVPA